MDKKAVGWCKGVTAASLLPEDVSVEEFKRMFRLNENTPHRHNPSIPEKWRKYFEGKKMLDPFAGFGSIPLEGLRLGLDVTASELLPTAYIFNKAVLEYPLKYGNKLVEDVKRWGEWITERLKEDEDIKELYDEDVAVYIGTWEVKCPHCGKWTPLIGNWWLARVKDSSGGFKRLAYMDYERSGDGVEIKVVDVNREVAKNLKGRLVDAIRDAKVDTSKGEIEVNGVIYRVPSSNLNSRREQAICLNCGSLIRFVDADGNHYTDKKDVAKDERNELEWYVKWALKKYHEGDESYARQRLLVKVKVENRNLVFEPCDERDNEKLEKAKEKVNEFRLILASLRGNLSQYIERLLSLLSRMNEELARKSIYPYVDPKEIKENLMSRISAMSAGEYEEYSKKLCQFICEKFRVEERRRRICNSDNSQKIWELMRGELKKIEDSLKTNIFFSSAIKPDDLHYLFTVKIKQDGKTVSEELILYKKSKEKIIYGLNLLKYLIELFNNSLVPLPSTTDINQFSLNIGLGEEARIKRECKERHKGSINRVTEYLEQATTRGYRENIQHPYRYNVELDKLAILIGMESQPEEIPEEIKSKIEEAAMELVMRIEEKEGRKPDKSPAKRNEHYDIYSYDPKTGEERFIEVKGHAGMQIFAELTHGEFEFGKDKKDKYWIYIVFNLTTAGDLTNAKWLRFQDATNTMNVKIKERTKYILTPKTQTK